VALRISNRQVDGVGVVELSGRIVLGEESNAMREQIKGMLAAGQKKIVLNLADVSYIDSAGLGALVAAHHSARTQGASLKLAHLGQKFQEILQVTKLLTVFEVHDTESAAVRSFVASDRASSDLSITRNISSAINRAMTTGNVFQIRSDARK